MLKLAERPATVNPETLFSETDALETRRAKALLRDRVKRAESEGPFSEMVLVTPAMASLLIERNDNNRTIKRAKLSGMVSDIKRGVWRLNGEPLIISDTGELNDGQHRCHAVIQAGRSIKTFVVFGVGRDTRLSVDQGGPKTVGDYLNMEGVESGNTAAAIAKYIWQYETFGGVSRAGNSNPTSEQVRGTFEKHPGIADSMRALPTVSRNVARSGSVVAFCHYLFAQRDRPAADAFVRRLLLGDGLTQNDPIYRCRERFIADSRMRLEDKVELIFRAWNASRNSRKVSKLQVMGGNLPAIER